MNNYALEILQHALMDEITCRSDATSMLNSGNLSKAAIGAFRESERMASERIPQLEEAIYLVKSITNPR